MCDMSSAGGAMSFGMMGPSMPFVMWVYMFVGLAIGGLLIALLVVLILRLLRTPPPVTAGYRPPDNPP
jgi:hypothetical protein